MKKSANKPKKVSIYQPAKIESKWQKQWAKSKLYASKDTGKDKFYVLDMFPYPSGEGLHVGHPKGYIATDIISRFYRMNGHSVLHPMGFDAFGLPAENYAIKMKTNPEIAVKKNVARYKKQLEILGFDYDWSREVNTSDPKFYKWTQWTFLQLYKKGLAYESNEPINWCPVDKTGLANEDIENGHCERCGALVEKKTLRQWVLRITDYADRMLNDLDLLTDWPESIKESQRNWIGRSEGAQVRFKIVGSENEFIDVYTTRIDTIFSGTFLILAPEHPYIQKFKDKIGNWSEVNDYVTKTSRESDMDRTAEGKDWTGVELKGIKVINPATNEEMPVWIADFVLGHYGTGAVFADAHDSRDFFLAKKYNIPLKVSIKPVDISAEEVSKLEKCFDKEGILFNSEQFDGLSSAEARPKIISWLKEKESAMSKVNYKLRDWVFSRQRYWGDPIPMVHCAKCGVVPVPEKDLPILLPKIKNYEPTGTGESPLAAIAKWVNTKCPTCKGPAKRETNTMPQWAGSSLYYLRYMDPKNSRKLVDSKKEKHWSPVDLYVGGAEHATRHLIYARFWHKFLYDIGVVTTLEPFKKLQAVGLIMGSDGRKMSKRFGNVVNPDEIVNTLGADTLRLYEMFMGPFDQQISWSTESMAGCRRFIEKVWRLQEKVTTKKTDSDAKHLRVINKTIAKVTSDIKELRFNTAISTLMIAVNEFESAETLNAKIYNELLKLIAPFAPHFTEEIWNNLRNKGSIHTSKWSEFDPKLAADTEVKIAVQVSGKIRGFFMVENNAEQSTLVNTAKALPEVKKWLDGKEIVKEIVIPNRLVNIVVK